MNTEATVKTETATKTVKRKYTPRGTTIVGKRVVLLNGVPVGRGRPAKEGKGKRTVVYIPANETYDVTKHGAGVEFRAKRHAALKRLKIANPVVDLATPATMPVEKPSEALEVL